MPAVAGRLALNRPGSVILGSPIMGDDPMNHDRMTATERMFFACALAACFLYGWMIIPSSGVLCVGETAVGGNGQMVECASLRARIGSACDVRWPPCLFR